jgi:hypothetical protein
MQNKPNFEGRKTVLSHFTEDGYEKTGPLARAKNKAKQTQSPQAS